ncbi:hypothetical protein [Vogesella mureinivorans]|uniref:hypothetical protein n=1 Tax=Vogesella mureinivorans TaxID=657276 RepID=UPI0014786EE6|nr:hypothetical protein [Vogesella mureinivorans]
MKRLLSLLLVLLVCCHSAFAGQALPVTPMQRTLSGVIQQKMFKRGFAANDPRFGATIDLVSSGTASVAGATAAAVVAGAITAPAWVSVAVAAGVGVVVTAAVSLAINGVVDWLFSDNPTDSTPIIQKVKQQPVGKGLLAGGPYWQSSILGIYGSDAMSPIQTAVAINWPADVTSTYEIGTCTSTSNPTKTTCLITRINKSTGYKQTGYAAIGATYYPSGAPGTCQPGYVFRNSSCIPVPALNAAPQESKVSIQQAIDNLSSEERAKPLNPEIVAPLADKLWRDAAAQPGYSGVPYLANDPITSADVEAWRQANPQGWPSVSDFIAPQPVSNSPWKLPATPTATTQDPTIATSPSTNPAANNPQQNLGSDPGIGSPNLETTPTAQQILQPILDLLPDFRSFVMPSHQAACPKATFDAFGRSMTMDVHCKISEEQRAALQAVMVAVWGLAAAFIILRA